MHHSFRILAILGLAVFIAGSDLSSQPLILTVRKEDSHVGFSIYKWGVFKEEGRFRDFSGTIKFDPNDPSRTAVSFTIQAASIDSRNERRDLALRSEEFFHISRFPTLTFKSTGAFHQNDLLMIEGDMTIRGISKRMTIPVKVLGINNAGRDRGTLVGFESTFTINREEFGVGEGWHILSKEATIHLLIGAGTGTVASR
ncbi:MAG: YceI family protein [Ignavibacterium sp.]|jgi:polyisoprenoid-binding protein YceI